MTLIVTPCWTTPDGTRTAADRYPVAKTEADAERLVRLGFEDARRPKGSDVVVLVGDGVTGRTVYRVRRRMVA